MALVADERCIVGERRRWRHFRGGDSVAVPGRLVTRCDGVMALALMAAAAERTKAADKRGEATVDETDTMEGIMVAD